MNVVLALNNEAERSAVAAALSGANHRVVEAIDGTSALRSALGFVEPYLAILDRGLAGLTGMQVCLCLRSPKLKVRPYVLLVNDRAEPGEVAKALDQGADGCLSRPWELVEIVARIRVAERTLQYQADLQQRIAELEAVVKRYDLLGEIVAQTGRGRATKPTAPDVRPTPAPRRDAEPCIPAVELSLTDADALMQRTIRELHFGNVGVLAKVVGECYTAAEISTWTGFILEREEIWYDLVLEVDRAAMAMIFEQTMGRPPVSEEERRDFLVETHTIASAGFKAELSSRGARVLSPVLSRVIPSRLVRSRELGPGNFVRYALAGGSIAFSLVRHGCPLRRKHIVGLDVFDVTAEDVPPPQEDEVPWLCKGSVLTPRFIHKLASLDRRRADRLVVPVYPGSPIAARILQEEECAVT